MKRRVSLEYLGYTVPVRGDGECWGRAEELQGGQSPKRQCLQVGLKTLDLKDVAKNLILYSQVSRHTMLKFKVSTLCNSLLSHLFSFNWGYIWSFKNIFKKWLKGLRNICIPMAEHWRIEAFELWCWRRLFWVPWTARRSKQSVLKETSPGCSLEGLLLKLKL